MASGSTSFVGDFCSGLKFVGVVDEKIETNKCSFFVAIQFSMCYTCITSSERPMDRE